MAAAVPFLDMRRWTPLPGLCIAEISVADIKILIFSQYPAPVKGISRQPEPAAVKFLWLERCLLLPNDLTELWRHMREVFTFLWTSAVYKCYNQYNKERLIRITYGGKADERNYFSRRR